MISIVDTQYTMATSSPFFSPAFTWSAAQAGDLLLIPVVKVTASGLNLSETGWTALLYGAYTMAYSVQEMYLVSKVAVGGETTQTISLVSGSGIKAAAFFNVRGTTGVITGPLYNSIGVGSVDTAEVLSGVPAGALSLSMFGGSDDFLDSGSPFTCLVSGAGWSEIVDTCSELAAQDQGGLTVATSTGTGSLAAGVGTFSRTVKSMTSLAFYLADSGGGGGSFVDYPLFMSH
jgi:hypothetical protein